jgi:coniferyl-aldehyde dehydrogenase
MTDSTQSTPRVPTVDLMNLKATVDSLRSAFAGEPYPSIEARIDRIDRCVDLLVDHQEAICAALNEDFGVRGPVLSRFADILAPIQHARHVRKHLRRWMRPQRRRPDFPYGLVGGKAYIDYQPLGVVGVIVPWNGPIGMAMVGAIDALSAGNRVLVKLSEHAPRSAELLMQLAPRYLSDTEAVFVTGDAEVARSFAELPLDHLLFTGGTEIGRNVMIAAARNLVPVTLELGGKCPAIVGPDADLAGAAARIVAGRLINSGQGCITPDYALVPRPDLRRFAELADQAARRLYPRIAGNSDYTSIINRRHFERILSYVEEARAAGCQVLESRPDGETLPDPARRLIAPTFVLDPPPQLRLMREEVFGPVLAVVPYDSLRDATDFVNRNPRPLALYYLGQNKQHKQAVLRATTSGGVTVNDTLLHLMMSELPFGGVGPSGTGRYWGGDSGFIRFSNPRSVFEQGWLGKLGELFQPPYGGTVERLLRSQIKKTR